MTGGWAAETAGNNPVMENKNAIILLGITSGSSCTSDKFVMETKQHSVSKIYTNQEIYVLLPCRCSSALIRKNSMLSFQAKSLWIGLMQNAVNRPPAIVFHRVLG
jgi:hypothetical protein